MKNRPRKMKKKKPDRSSEPDRSVQLNRFCFKPPLSRVCLLSSLSSLSPKSSCPVPFPEPFDPASPFSHLSPMPISLASLSLSASSPLSHSNNPTYTPSPPNSRNRKLPTPTVFPNPSTTTNSRPRTHLRCLHRHRPHLPPAHHKSTVKVEGDWVLKGGRRRH